MRLFIYNNQRLKYVFNAPYNGESNLAAIFNSLIDAEDINLLPNPVANGPKLPDPKKTLLWATAKRTLRNIKFDDSKFNFGIAAATTGTISKTVTKWNPKENRYGRTVNVVKDPTIGYDFYLDRGTGWCALSRDYSVYREIDSKGNIPDKHDYMTVQKTLPWLDFSNKFLGFTTSGSNVLSGQLLAGSTSIIPFGVGTFYGQPKAMSKDNFEHMSRLASTLTNTVNAVSLVEWPCMVFDKSYEPSWFEEPKVPNQAPKDQRDRAADAEKLRTAMMAEGNLTKAAVTGIDQDHLGRADYLTKMQELDNYLATAYRQMKFLTSSTNFNDHDLDKAWYQSLYSGALFVLGNAIGLVANVLGESAGALPLPESVAKGAVAEPAKELLTSAKTYLLEQRKLYNQGGKAEGIDVTIGNIQDSLQIAYAAYELFLIKWGICYKVTGRTEAKIRAKLVKLKDHMQNKVKLMGPIGTKEQIEKQLTEALR